jgi:hypothetical protein
MASPFEASLGALLERGLAPDAATLARRARQARARLGATEVARIETAMRSGAIPAATADAGAALLAERARSMAPGTVRDRLIGALAAAAIARVRAGRITGSRWAVAGACGLDFEDTPEDERGMMDCGMGHASARSRRFLYFYRQG